MSDLERAQAHISELLDQVATHFKGTPKITLLVRNDVGFGRDGDFVMTNDELPLAIAALEHRLWCSRQ